MDAKLVENWNKVVKPNDLVLHLGDVFWMKNRAAELTKQLNGRKQVVLGNHDPNADFFAKLDWEPLTSRRNEHCYFYRADIQALLAHRPRDLPTWREENIGPGRIVLCGHEHTNAPIFIMWVRDKSDKARPIMALNMSCEHWGYIPVHWDVVVDTYHAYLNQHISPK